MSVGQIGQVGSHAPVTNTARTESFENKFPTRLDASHTSNAKETGKSTFCCGKGCCSGGQNAKKLASLNLDPALLEKRLFGQAS